MVACVGAVPRFLLCSLSCHAGFRLARQIRQDDEGCEIDHFQLVGTQGRTACGRR